jgi:hypothetical protein
MPDAIPSGRRTRRSRPMSFLRPIEKVTVRQAAAYVDQIKSFSIGESSGNRACVRSVI